MNEDLFDNARWLIGAIARGLAARPGEGVDEVLGRLAEQAIGEAAFRNPDPVRLPVLQYLPDCIGEVMLLDPDLAADGVHPTEKGYRMMAGLAERAIGEALRRKKS